MTFSNCQWFMECWPFPRRRTSPRVSQPNTMVHHEVPPPVRSSSPSEAVIIREGGGSIESDTRSTRIQGNDHKRNTRLETVLTSHEATRPLQAISPSDPAGLLRLDDRLESSGHDDNQLESRDSRNQSIVTPNPRRKRWVSASLNFLRRRPTPISNPDKSDMTRRTTTSRWLLFGQAQRSSAPLPKGAKLHPVGLYDHLGSEGKLLSRTIDLKLVKKWIRDQRRLAPFFEGTMTVHHPTTTTTDRKNAEHPTSISQETSLVVSTTENDIDRDPIECPICLLYYPRDCINRSRCCRQPICTECFLYMSAARCIIPRTTPPSSNSIFSTNEWFPGEIVHLNGRRYWRRRQTAEEQQSIDQLITCPFCTAPCYGVVYLPDYCPEKGDTNRDHQHSDQNNDNNSSNNGDVNNPTHDAESSEAVWKQSEKRVVSCSMKHFVLEEIPSIRASSLIDEQTYYSALVRRGRRQARQTLSTDRLTRRDQLELFRRLLNSRTNQDMPPEFLEQLRHFIEQRGPITESSFNGPQRDHLWNLAEELLVMHTLRISANEQSPTNPAPPTHSPSSLPLSSRSPLSTTTTTTTTTTAIPSSVSSEHCP
jgi:hypothetical protein